MKVNLLTIHYSLNYGALLQTYATVKVLQLLGCEVTLIDFVDRNDIKERVRIKSLITNGVRWLKFCLFKRSFYPRLTKRMYSFDFSLLPEVDCYISGSDQIWNPKIVGDKLLTYMFASLKHNVKRISYASSFGLNKWDIVHNNDVKQALDNYSAISVREDSGVEICKNEFGIEATQVLDPTLLFGDYSELIENVKPKERIVCFKFIQDDNFFHCLDCLEADFKLKSIIMSAFSPKMFFDKYRHCYNPSPRKWLKNIASARFVLTDSFHGLAFAIIFNKDFIVLPGHQDRTTRLSSLLDILGLSERLVLDSNDFELRKKSLYKKIDYERVNALLSQARSDSLAYLKNALFN